MLQYPTSLPLLDKEVVITFDDGPLPPCTSRILDVLGKEGIKATFFIIGKMAAKFPALVRRIHNEGHTIGTHSQNHPLPFSKLSPEAAIKEVEQGIDSAASALGDRTRVAPFFRFPGLGRSSAVEAYLRIQSMSAWSADFVADDWTGIGPGKVIERVCSRLSRKNRGVLLLHDIQCGTVQALPDLLVELKRREYRVVHAIPTRIAP
jgi:peptidoglycan/xylan/chitin deacetylase (PgdA/CDA1 family)